MTTRGIVIVAFGVSYFTLAKAVVRASQRHTSLPFHIITNVNPNANGDGFDGCTIERVDQPIEQNRRYKVCAQSHSPFDETLLMDADSVVAAPGIEAMFDRVSDGGFDVAARLNYRFDDKLPQIYKRHMLKCGARCPIDVYHTALVLLADTDGARRLSQRWYDNWLDTGKQRDMPSFACALQSTRPALLELADTDWSYTRQEKGTTTVQHCYAGRAGRFYDEFGLPNPAHKWRPSHKTNDFSFTRWNGGR